MSLFDTTPNLASPYKQPGLVWWGNATNPFNDNLNLNDGDFLTLWDNMTNAFNGLVANNVNPGTYHLNGVATNKSSVLFTASSNIAYKVTDPNGFLEVGTAFTFYAICKLTSSASTLMSIFGKGASSVTPDYIFMLNRSIADGTLSLFTGGGFIDSVSKISNTTQFNVLACTFDATTTPLQFYANGVALTASTTMSSLNTSTDPFIIGAQNTTTPVNYFNGEIADTLVYNCAHTFTQITEMTNFFKNRYGLNF